MGLWVVLVGRRIGLLGLSALRNKPVPPQLVCNPPDLSINIPDLLDMSLGPSSVFRVRLSGPRLALRGPWAGRPTTMQLTAGAIFDGRVLTGCPLAGLCAASPPRPIRTETGCKAGFSKSCVVSLIH